MKKAVNEATEHTEDLAAHLRSESIPFKEIIPVRAVIRYPRGMGYGPDVRNRIR